MFNRVQSIVCTPKLGPSVIREDCLADDAHGSTEHPTSMISYDVMIKCAHTQ